MYRSSQGHAFSRENLSRQKGGRAIRLRILATIDLHGHLRAFDYVAGRTKESGGLTSLAPVIEAMRDGPWPSILVDAGDFLTGTFLADQAMEQPDDEENPVIAAMNALQYDAVALGNHDMDFGLRSLRTALREADFPVLGTNLIADEPAGPVVRTAMVTRTMHGDDDGERSIRIGILSALPPHTVAELRHAHTDMADLRMEQPIEALTQGLDDLRSMGADICLVLCHEGPSYGTSNRSDLVENIAALDGVDAIVMGHRHAVFPAEGAPSDGDIGGVPAIMPGCYGRHLGCIDLSLEFEGNGWRVLGHQSRVYAARGAVDTDVSPALRVHAVTADAHARAEASAGRILGRMPRPATSYFARLGRDPGTMLVARVMRDVVADAFPDLDPAYLIGLAGPPHTGWQGGRDSWTNLPAGEVRLAQMARLHPYAERICAVTLSGDDLRAILVRSAAGFRFLPDHADGREIVNDRVPGLELSLSPDIDVTFDLSSERPNGRVRDIRVRGRALDFDARYTVAMSFFRACGGRAWPGCSQQKVRYGTLGTVQSALVERGLDLVDESLWQPCFTLRWPTTVRPVFTTAPEAAHVLDLIEDLGPVTQVDGAGARARFRLGAGAG